MSAALLILGASTFAAEAGVIGFIAVTALMNWLAEVQQ